jgi:Acyl-CoA thioesterase C-terminal domain/Acyl-CoA thioesterase N-terminal domain
VVRRSRWARRSASLESPGTPGGSASRTARLDSRDEWLSTLHCVYAFDVASAVKPAGEGCYEAVLDGAWSIAGKLNGGYLLTVAARAALAEAGEGHQHPVAATAAFAAPAPAGPALVTVEALRIGRGTSVLRARLSSPGGGTPYLDALVTAGRIGDGEPVVPAPVAPRIPSEERCPRLPVDAGPFRVPMLGVVAERLDPATAGFGVGRPSGAGELRGWVRFDDGREPDPLALVTVADALPPPSFDVPGLSYGWTPTLQYSVFVRGVPAAGPLLVRTVARSITGGAMDETCDVWDSAGRHVAVAHQLAGVRSAHSSS